MKEEFKFGDIVTVTNVWQQDKILVHKDLKNGIVGEILEIAGNDCGVWFPSLKIIGLMKLNQIELLLRPLENHKLTTLFKRYLIKKWIYRLYF